ncbi:MAG: hypothetical protein LLG14_09735 [Nocardiaceae bacterium]|nr:hypothetical protein [Nocardiaceae bacterium]
MGFQVGYVVMLLLLIGLDAAVVYFARANARPLHVVAISALTTIVTMMVVGLGGYLYAASSLEEFFDTTADSGSHREPTLASTHTSSPGDQLTPDQAGSVWIKTKSERTSCQVIAAQVGCSADFDTAPTTECCGKANGVIIKPSGQTEWVTGNMPNSAEWTVLDYGTYHAAGWTIDAKANGTTFTNDATGHGAKVAIESVTSF